MGVTLNPGVIISEMIQHPLAMIVEVAGELMGIASAGGIESVFPFIGEPCLGFCYNYTKGSVATG
jgi:hypothetical protein